MSIDSIINAARGRKLDFGGDVLAFSFRNPSGEEWEGCIEEWIGNVPILAPERLEHNRREYAPIGSSGGGADLLLVRDDGVICYFNDYDQTISEVARTLDEFVRMLRPPT